MAGFGEWEGLGEALCFDKFFLEAGPGFGPVLGFGACWVRVGGAELTWGVKFGGFF